MRTAQELGPASQNTQVISGLKATQIQSCSGQHSLVVSASGDDQKVVGSNPIRVIRNISALTAPTQSWQCYGPHGKALTPQSSFIYLTDATLRVLL